MNRRNFINGLLTVGAGFMVLPSAGRIWKAQRRIEQVVFWMPKEGVIILNPEWVKAQYDIHFPAVVAGYAD